MLQLGSGNKTAIGVGPAHAFPQTWQVFETSLGLKDKFRVSKNFFTLFWISKNFFTLFFGAKKSNF
jgi:hypothetical protein